MAFSMEEKLDSFMTEITNNFTKLNERLDNYEAKLEKKCFELERISKRNLRLLIKGFLSWKNSKQTLRKPP